MWTDRILPIQSSFKEFPKESLTMSSNPEKEETPVYDNYRCTSSHAKRQEKNSDHRVATRICFVSVELHKDDEATIKWVQASRWCWSRGVQEWIDYIEPKPWNCTMNNREGRSDFKLKCNNIRKKPRSKQIVSSLSRRVLLKHSRGQRRKKTDEEWLCVSTSLWT